MILKLNKKEFQRYKRSLYYLRNTNKNVVAVLHIYIFIYKTISKSLIKSRFL